VSKANRQRKLPGFQRENPAAYAAGSPPEPTKECTMLRILVSSAIAAGLCVLVAGCGDQRLRTQGHVVRGGQPLIPKEGESVRVTFVPILADGKPPSDHYFAEFNRADASFLSAGKDKKGMPPGKYRVAIEYKKDKQDVFGGKFDENRSPYVFDVDSKTKDVVIDLDNPPGNSPSDGNRSKETNQRDTEPQKREGRENRK
jgi:hypothetical protein